MNRYERDTRELFSIADLAAEFGITTRAIRFYEQKKLLSPERIGKTRVFKRRDRARLILILRGKRLGFSLKDIHAYLSLYDADPMHSAQNAHLIEMIDARTHQLTSQLGDLQTTLKELSDIRKVATADQQKAQLRKQA